MRATLSGPESLSQWGAGVRCGYEKKGPVPVASEARRCGSELRGLLARVRIPAGREDAQNYYASTDYGRDSPAPTAKDGDI